MQRFETSWISTRPSGSFTGYANGLARLLEPSIVPPRGRMCWTLLRVEVDVLLLVEALEAVADADDLPAERLARVQRHRADHAVETGAVAAAGQDADACAHAVATYSAAG